jgi:predicted Zn-dependent protease
VRHEPQPGDPAVYAQAFTRRYLTVTGGEVVYSGEEQLDGISVGRALGRHDLWIDSLDPSTVRRALGGMSDAPRPTDDVLEQARSLRACPAAVADAVRAAVAVDAGRQVRFEFELVQRRALIAHHELDEPMVVGHCGVRCRVMVESPAGTDRGRSYVEATSQVVSDLDLAAAVLAAEREAEGVVAGIRLDSASQMPVLLEPAATAALLHELCGHTLEADVPADSGVCFADSGGEQVSVPELTVFDDPTRLDLWGGYSYDDEGRPAERVDLLRAGRVGQSLRDESTRGELGSNGHGRRSSHQLPAVPRMSNLVVEPGEATPEDLHAAARGGIRIDTIERAQLVPRQGVVLLHARLAHRVHDDAATPLAPVVVKGGIRDLLGAISLVGSQRDVFSGYCGKANQRIAFGAEAPALLLSEALVIPY